MERKYTVIGAADYESLGDIQTQKSAKTVAFDSKSKRLFLSAPEMESASAVAGQKVRIVF